MLQEAGVEGMYYWNEPCKDAGVRKLGPFSIYFDGTIIDIPNEVWAIDTGGQCHCKIMPQLNSWYPDQLNTYVLG